MLLYLSLLQEALCFLSHSSGRMHKSLVSSKIVLRRLYSNIAMSSDYVAALIVPTGIGAKIGGYAGDAIPSAKLIASVADVLITHPNVMNGAMLFDNTKSNILYVEGNALNQFAASKLAFQPLRNGACQKIGVIFDKAVENTLLQRHVQVINAFRATLGIEIAQCVVTSKELGIETLVSKLSGASWGNVKNIDSLLEAAHSLKNSGCTSIAVIGRFPEDDEQLYVDEVKYDISERTTSTSFDAYRSGNGVDGIAGMEAIISHLVSQELNLPCAHAPAFDPMDVGKVVNLYFEMCSYPFVIDKSVDPKACAEEIGYTFLPCILAYLHKAPNLIPIHSAERKSGLIYAENVNAVVVPYNALGGPAVLHFLEQSKSHNTIIIAVEDNHTAMKVTKECFSKEIQRRIITVRSYAEAAGIIAAHKAGIFLESITPKVGPVKITKL